MIKPFLKWMGGKGRVIPELKKVLPLPLPGVCFVEPFVGAGSVFLNTCYDKYILADTNSDLISLLNTAKSFPDKLIEEGEALFRDGNNVNAYMSVRDNFNSKKLKGIQRDAAFLYLIRHGFNGMCRYNGAGLFNVPFGRYNTVYFPKAEIAAWAKRCNETDVTIVCDDYLNVLKSAPDGSVIYADPPYLPLSDTAKHTQYWKKSFNQNNHRELAAILKACASRDCQIVLSNADTPLTRDIYHGMRWHEISVGRFMSAKSESRKMVTELIGIL